jgi:hypothetical protein
MPSFAESESAKLAICLEMSSPNLPSDLVRNPIVASRFRSILGSYELAPDSYPNFYAKSKLELKEQKVDEC